MTNNSAGIKEKISEDYYLFEQSCVDQMLIGLLRVYMDHFCFALLLYTNCEMLSHFFPMKNI